jgi:F-type H+-transporting ATPase subunit b
MRRLSPSKLVALAFAATVLLALVAAAPAATAQERGPTAPAQEPEQQHAAQEQDDHAASQEGHGDDEHADEAHADEPKPWYYWPAKWTNFVLLVAFLWWMLVSPPAAIQDIFSFAGLKVILRDRAAGIIAARELAAQQKEEASRLLSESDERLAAIEQEVAALVQTARSDAEREATRSLEEGKQQADKILHIAEREVKHERLTAQRQLRGFVADLAVKLAERNLEDHLTADDQDRLIRDYLSRLGDSMA